MSDLETISKNASRCLSIVDGIIGLTEEQLYNSQATGRGDEAITIPGLEIHSSFWIAPPTPGADPSSPVRNLNRLVTVRLCETTIGGRATPALTYNLLGVVGCCHMRPLPYDSVAFPHVPAASSHTVCNQLEVADGPRRAAPMLFAADELTTLPASGIAHRFHDFHTALRAIVHPELP